jgi:outer membrane protein TolC
MQSAEQVRIAEDSLRRAVDLMGVNRQLVAAGRLAAVEIVQSEANVARQELSLLSARNSLDAARLDLLQILALDVNIGLTPTEKLTAQPLRMDLAHALATARAHRTDYRQAFLLRDISRLNLRLAEDGLRWELNAVGSAAVNSSGGTFTRTLRRAGRTEPGVALGLELRIPISNLSDQARAVSARIALQQQELSLQDLEQRLEVEVRNALRTVEISWKSQKLAEQAVKLSEQKLDIERQRLRAGRSSNFQVVTFEDDLVRTRTDLLSARIGYLNALTSLDDVLGTTLQTWGVSLEAM